MADVLGNIVSKGVAAMLTGKNAVQEVESSSEGCENEIKPYSLQYRQLTRPQLVEIINSISSKDLELDADRLGAENNRLRNALKGKLQRI